MSWRAALSIATAEGEFTAVFTEEGLAELHFPNDRRAHGERPVPNEIRQWHNLTTAAVQSILEGEAPGALPPLDLARHSSFQRKVWAELLRIEPGKTLSYGELASRVGVPSGARAVGSACGANPIPVIIPCHRILTSDGRLGGFSGGLDWKRRLLNREGVKPREPEPGAGKRRLHLTQPELAYF